MQEVKLCEGVGVVTGLLDKISLFGFANGQVCLPLYSLCTGFGYHRNYKRKKREKRPKKIWKSQKKTLLFGFSLKVHKKGRDKKSGLIEEGTVIEKRHPFIG